MDAMKKLSGWRKTALYLTILATILTTFLVTALIISLHVINGGGASIFGETAILSGSCDRVSRANLWIHLAINVIGTGVLGSSSFFMQVLVAPNSLWFAGRYNRFKNSRGLITNSTNNNTVLGYYMQLDPDTGAIYMNETKYEPAFRTMKVDYCLSEIFHAPCRLSIANPLLLIVCIMCISKCLLCSYTLKVRSWSTEEPLMTVGDAISSFIAKPDTCTKGICTLDAEDLHMKLDPERALGSSRPWKKKQVVSGNAVNPGIWILSYMLIGSLLVLGGLLLAPALQTQSL